MMSGWWGYVAAGGLGLLGGLGAYMYAVREWPWVRVRRERVVRREVRALDRELETL